MILGRIERGKRPAIAVVCRRLGSFTEAIGGKHADAAHPCRHANPRKIAGPRACSEKRRRQQANPGDQQVTEPGDK